MNSHWKLRKFVAWVKLEEKKKTAAKEAETEVDQKSTSSKKSESLKSVTTRTSGKRGTPEKGQEDSASMEAQAPVMVENPTATTKTENLMLNALQRIGQRLDKLESKEKEGSTSSWQDAAASSDRK